MSRRGATGLTLVEMMVVLMIAGMALALGFQALRQWQLAEATLTRAGLANRDLQLTEDWIETSLRGLVPLPEPVFSGRADRLEGFTVGAVQAPPGATVPLAWTIAQRDGQLSLGLDEGGQALWLPLPDASSARFVYFDDSGQTSAQWPPALGTATQLPAGVAVVQDLPDGQKRVWAAVVSGPRDPVDRPFEMEDF